MKLSLIHNSGLVKPNCAYLSSSSLTHSNTRASTNFALTSTMLFNFGLLTSLLAITSITASPLTSNAPSSSALERRNNDITHLGAVGKTLSGGTKFGDLVFVSGQVPLVNGTIVPGGIKNETALCIQRVGEILAEAGTDWSRVLKVTVLLQGMSTNCQLVLKDLIDFVLMFRLCTCFRWRW
jgi:enamine deaminase RidA (YjgF/YER057c/UK114 family)